MHSTVLATAGYTLLLSSFIMFLILLKRGFRQCTKSSLYTMPTSDTLSSAVTAILLLTNQIGMIVKMDFNHLNNNYYKDNMKSALSKNGDNNSTENTDENIFNTTSSCDMTDMIMHYAILFVPLTNTFVSLLSLSLYCNLKIKCIESRCIKLLHLQDHRDSASALETHDLEAGTSKIASNRHERAMSNNTLINKTKDVLAFFHQLKENNQTVAAVCVLSQWLVPVIITGVLYFAENNNTNSIWKSKNRECIFEMNFLFEDCDTSAETPDILEISNTEFYIPTTNNNYIDNESLTRVSNSHDAKINEIVSKIHNIVLSILNHTVINNTYSGNFYNSSDLLNVTKYVTSNDILTTNYDSSTETSFIKETMEYTTLPFTITTEEKYNILHSSEQETDTENIEITLFENLLKQTPQESGESTPIEVKDIIERSTEATVSQSTRPFFSKDQIYADIVKRIQDITKPGGLKNQFKYHNRKQPRHLEDQAYKTDLTENVLAFIENNLNHDNITLTKIPICMKDKCFASTKFLKLHLLITMFVIYFLPILFSSILQAQSKLNCQSISEKLEEKFERSPGNVMSSVKRDVEIINPIALQESFQSGWFDRSSNNSTLSRQASSIENPCNFNKKYRTQCTTKNDGVYNNELGCVSLIKEVAHTQKLLQSAKISLLLGVILWTPLFIQTLLKMFLCVQSPKWIVNITFLSAISFGVIRNVLNFNMIKIQEHSIYTKKKENSICPIE